MERRRVWEVSREGGRVGPEGEIAPKHAHNGTATGWCSGGGRERQLPGISEALLSTCGTCQMGRHCGVYVSVRASVRVCECVWMEGLRWAATKHDILSSMPSTTPNKQTSNLTNKQTDKTNKLTNEQAALLSSATHNTCRHPMMLCCRRCCKIHHQFRPPSHRHHTF